MSRTIAELDKTEQDNLVASIKALVPAHTHWVTQPGITTKVASETGTWSTPAAMWSIEINFITNRYVVRQGSENKWTRFDDDMAWLEFTLEHLGALT